ncbi:major capsid protein [Dickeya phage Sucellus]|nr:major capsid protein [Dickeya phage Sucellus]
MNKLIEMYKKLSEKRKALADLNTAIGTAQMTDEQRAQWDGLSEELSTLREAIVREEELRSTDAVIAGKVNDEKPAENKAQAVERRSLFDSYLRSHTSAIPTEVRAAMAEMRAMNTGVPADGGYTIDTQTLGTIVQQRYTLGGVTAACRVLPTSKGNPMAWSVSKEGIVRGVIVKEATNHGKSSSQFDSVTLSSFKISSQVILVSEELLTDSEADIAGYVVGIARNRIDRGINNYVIRGTGVEQPKGIINSVTAGMSTEIPTVADFTYDDVIDLYHSVDPAYRSDPSFAYATHDKTLRQMRKWKDEEGRPLYIRSLSETMPDTFGGDRIIIDNDMPELAAGAKGFMLAGMFSSVIIRRVGGMTVRRLDELYAETGQVGFLAYERFDCLLEDQAAMAMLSVAEAGGGANFVSEKSPEEKVPAGTGGFTNM